MVRTTVTIPEELLERLKRIAAKRGVPVSVIIREAIEDKSSREDRPEPELPRRFLSMGMGASKPPHDTARRAGDDIPEPPPWR